MSMTKDKPARAIVFAFNANDFTIAADRRLEYILHRDLPFDRARTAMRARFLFRAAGLVD
jgi:hypothetical protein